MRFDEFQANATAATVSIVINKYVPDTFLEWDFVEVAPKTVIIRSTANQNLCLSLAGGSTADGTLIQCAQILPPSHPDYANQIFTLEDAQVTRYTGGRIKVPLSSS
jgi:hypothetical protein